MSKISFAHVTIAVHKYTVSKGTRTMIGIVTPPSPVVVGIREAGQPCMAAKHGSYAKTLKDQWLICEQRENETFYWTEVSDESPSPSPSLTESPAPTESTSTSVVTVSTSHAAYNLPVTGSSTSAIAGIGLAVIVFGTVIFAAARRRKYAFKA